MSTKVKVLKNIYTFKEILKKWQGLKISTINENFDKKWNFNKNLKF